MTAQSLGDWEAQIYGTRHEIPSCGVDLKSNQNVVGCPITIHTTVAPVGASFLTGQYCSMQVPALGKIIDFCFLL